MKRITLIGVAVLVAAAVFASLGVASRGTAPSSVATPSAKPKKPAAKPKLPALPAAVKSRKRWNIGVKCDFPPFGFIDVRGNNDGYDVQIARRFAQLAFGNKTKV